MYAFSNDKLGVVRRLDVHDFQTEHRANLQNDRLFRCTHAVEHSVETDVHVDARSCDPGLVRLRIV